MRRKILLFILFTCVHTVVALSASMYEMVASSARFDNPQLPQLFGARAAETAANVLTLPGRLVWTSWASQNLPNNVEWLLFIANSAMWSAIGVSVAARVSGGRHRRADAV
jgi:hypothetical protein